MLERFNRTTRLIIAICLAVVIWIAGMIIGQEQTVTILNPEGGWTNIINRQPTIKVSLMVDPGNGQIRVYQDQQLTYGQTVYDLLKKLNQNEAELKFKAQIDPVKDEVTGYSLAGRSNIAGGAEWTLWLNNNLRPEPVNQVKLKARDIIELKYAKLITL